MSGMSGIGCQRARILPSGRMLSSTNLAVQNAHIYYMEGEKIEQNALSDVRIVRKA